MRRNILRKVTSQELQFTTFQTAHVLNFQYHESCPLQTTFSLMHPANIFFFSVSFQQSSRGARTTGVGCPARRLVPSPTVSSGRQAGAPAPTAAAQVSPPAPQTGTGPVACRLRPDCARSGRARLCCQGSEGCSRSVHNQHINQLQSLFH